MLTLAILMMSDSLRILPDMGQAIPLLRISLSTQSMVCEGDTLHVSSDQGYTGELCALCSAEINVREGGREGRGGVSG